MSINTKVLNGVHFRTPNKFDKYENPWDNLIYAILYQAMQDARGYYKDHKHISGEEAIQFLDDEGRQMYNYLKTRPLARASKDALRMRKQREGAKKRVLDTWLQVYDE